MVSRTLVGVATVVLLGRAGWLPVGSVDQVRTGRNDQPNDRAAEVFNSVPGSTSS
jgi:hypothetical protein